MAAIESDETIRKRTEAALQGVEVKPGGGLVCVWYRIEREYNPGHWAQPEEAQDTIDILTLNNPKLDQLYLMRRIAGELRKLYPDTKYRIVRITEESVE